MPSRRRITRKPKPRRARTTVRRRPPNPRPTAIELAVAARDEALAGLSDSLAPRWLADFTPSPTRLVYRRAEEKDQGRREHQAAAGRGHTPGRVNREQRRQIWARFWKDWPPSQQTTADGEPLTDKIRLKILTSPTYGLVVTRSALVKQRGRLP